MVKNAAGALALVGLLGLAARSAPILPEGLSPEVRTTAGINRVRLVVMPLPKILRGFDVRREWIDKQFTGQLEENGVEVVDDGESDAPILRVVTTVFTDESVPGAVGYVTFIALEQSVTVDRLGESFRIPTWTGSKAGMKSRAELADGFRATLQDTIGQFLRRSRMADWSKES